MSESNQHGSKQRESAEETRSNSSGPAAITPIFVLGSARNGTTWLCNALAGHPAISAVQHQAHWGFHESNLYKQQRYWGSLAESERLIRCVELYGSGDHFRLAGGSKEQAYRWKPADFYELFFNLMDGFAAQNGTAFWLTKLDPLYYQHPRALRELLARLEKRYGTVHFVAIKRDLPAVIRSYLNMEGRAGQHRTAPGIAQLLMLFETARYVVHYRRIARLIRQKGAPFLSYRELSADAPAALGRALAPLGLKHDERMLEPRFAANSSVAFRSGGGRKLYAPEAALLRSLVRPALSALFPLALLMLALRERSKPVEPPVYFKLLKLERMPERYKAELAANDERGLLSVLFGESDQHAR